MRFSIIAVCWEKRSMQLMCLLHNTLHKSNCLLLWFLFLVICKYSFQKSTVVIILLNGFQNRTELRIIRHLCQLIVEHRAETSSHIFPCYILVPKISG